MKIKIFADTICGWCFIGQTRLNNALKIFPKTKFEIEHIPFQLNPDMPKEGIERNKYLEIKFGGKEFAQPMYDRMTEEANKENLNFNLDKIKKTPNTVLSHLLIKLAKQSNAHNEIKEKIYQSYFIDGLDIGDINILVDIAKKNNITENIFKDFINEKNIEEINKATKGLNDSNKFFKTYPLKITSSKIDTPVNNMIEIKIFSKLKEYPT